MAYVKNGWLIIEYEPPIQISKIAYFIEQGHGTAIFFSGTSYCDNDGQGISDYLYASCEYNVIYKLLIGEEDGVR